MTKYTLTRRHDNVVLEMGVEGYMNALTRSEAYRNVDVMIHEDGTCWMEEKRKNANTYDYTQGGWAYI